LDHVPVDRWMELIITPVPVPTTFGGADKCMLMTFHDQTPLRRVEEMRADFVANASHELRTPLAALSGFIDTLQGQAKDDPKARERFLGIMHNQATRMARLIDDLLSLSRVELSAHVRPDTPWSTCCRSFSRSPTGSSRWPGNARSRSRPTFRKRR
ncbi:hypothetical protein K7461_29530, partial [Pseudomonas fluorescens]|nr:hypothetical protein [Pseudomonas fluorescens]